MEIFNKSCPWLSMKNVLSHSCSISVISMFKFLLLVNSDMDGREKWKHKHKHDKIYGLIINVAAQMIFQMKCSLNGWQVIDGSVVCEEDKARKITKICIFMSNNIEYTNTTTTAIMSHIDEILIKLLYLLSSVGQFTQCPWSW